MDTDPNDPVDALRSDFDLYKTQVAICAWCAVVVVFLLICTVIYSLILIRRLKVEYKETMDMYQRIERFTIDRPKLILPSQNSTPINSPTPPRSPSAINQSGGQSPRPNGVVRSPKSPVSPVSPIEIRNGNNKKPNESFLNKNRRSYNPSSRGDVTPQNAPTPTLVKSPTNKGVLFFKY